MHVASRRSSHGRTPAVGQNAREPMPPLAPSRTSTFRRAGTASLGVPSAGNVDMHATLSTPSGAASPMMMRAASGDAMETSESEVTEDPCASGLTVASLKHLRRQRDKLTEEKTRLEKELTAIQKQMQEQRDRIATLEAEALEAAAREASLKEEACQARESEHMQRQRAIEAEALNAKLEESLAQREAEVAHLKKALEEQRRLTRDVCEAAGSSSSSDTVALQTLQTEKAALEAQLRACRQELEDMKRHVVMAMAAAEKAVAVQAHIESLKAAKLSEAINQKVELHISVPRVTLSYNNAPPIFVSVAAALSEGRIRDLLEKEVFPHFDCLWVRMDKLDKAPDGTSKREYSQRMLSRLTEAVRRFVARSQEDTDPVAAKGCHVSLPPLQPSSSLAASGGDRGSTDRASISTSGDGRGASINDSDRARLLALLRSGDERGLDSKLVEMLGSR